MEKKGKISENNSNNGKLIIIIIIIIIMETCIFLFAENKYIEIEA